MTHYFKTEKYNSLICLEKVEPFSITNTAVCRHYSIENSHTIQVDKEFYHDRLERLASHQDFEEITESEYNNILNFKTQ
jgi:hypothetical protein